MGGSSGFLKVFSGVLVFLSEFFEGSILFLICFVDFCLLSFLI